jgi:hypothetical protein
MDNCNFKHVDFTCKRIGTGLVVAGYKVMMLDSLLEPVLKCWSGLDQKLCTHTDEELKEESTIVK